MILFSNCSLNLKAEITKNEPWVWIKTGFKKSLVLGLTKTKDLLNQGSKKFCDSVVYFVCYNIKASCYKC